MTRYTHFIIAAGLLSVASFSCKETIVDPPASSTNDAFHGDIVGSVLQKESGAVVYISQVKVVDSARIDPGDGSFAFHGILLGNYDLMISASDFRIYQRSNVMVPGGGVVYVGQLDLSTVPDLVSSYYPPDQSEIVYDNRFARLAISIAFTQPMDRESVEKSFSTDPPSTGIFYWGAYSSSPMYALYALADQLSPVNQGAVITTLSKITSFTYVLSGRDSYVDTTYAVTLTTDAHDTSGNHLRFPLRFTFKTVESSQTIYGIQTDPVDGDIDVAPISYNGIRITFPRRMDQTSTEHAISIVPSDPPIFIWPQPNQLTIYTGGLYRADTTYLVVVDSTAKDLDGNPLGMRFSFSFQTAPVLISSTTPINGELFVSYSQPVSLVFNTYVVRSSVDSAFSISPFVPGTLVYGNQYSQDQKNMVSFIPSAALLPNTKYTVTVGTQVKDFYGKRLKEPYGFSFITRPN
ncbi:MAG: Ig-like domain-containing protein [Bacteroidota bacterium]|jgi:hypothetical protein